MFIRKALRFVVGEAVGYTLLLTGVARIFFRNRVARGEITAFYLHNPSEKLFRRLVHKGHDWGCEFVSVETLYVYLSKKERPAAPIIFISVDDGWRDNISNIARLAEKQGVPVCYFITTDAMHSGDFWWCRVNDPEKIQELKTVSNHERLKHLDAYLPCSQRVAMTSVEVATLAKMKHATIGNHTQAHSILPQCTKDELHTEITAAHHELSHLTAKVPTAFSYPNGDCDGRERLILKDLGYVMAFTTEARWFSVEEADMFRLPRFCANENGGFAENFCRMIGLWQTISDNLKRFTNRGRRASRNFNAGVRFNAQTQDSSDA